MTDEALEAAGHWGGAASLRLIRDRENSVFEARLPTGPAALRLHRTGYQTEAAIRSELWWCDALAAAGIAVPRPLPARDGAFLHHLSTGRLASALAWVDGAAMGEAGAPLSGDAGAQAALHHALGALVARFHAATDALTLPEDFTRPRWDVAGLLGEAPFWGRFWEHADLTAAERDLMRQARAWLVKRIGGRADLDFGLIHADVLRENVLVVSTGLTLIDLDDSGFGYRLYDLGTTLSQALDEPHLESITTALIEGYASVRPLSAEDRAMIPVFTLMRCCASVGWTMSRVPPGDPIRRRHIDRALRLAPEVMAGRGPGQTSSACATCSPTPNTRL